jgi:hypothetical protein
MNTEYLRINGLRLQQTMMEMAKIEQLREMVFNG